MKTISKGITGIWKDGSIRKKSKSELLREFRAYFNCNTIDRFYDLINQDAEPTKIEEYFINSKVREYWQRSNPIANIENAIKRHEKENRPIIKRNLRAGAETRSRNAQRKETINDYRAKQIKEANEYHAKTTL